MKVVIVGAGEVGFHIADRLSREGHDVTVVERDEEKSRELRGKLDALIVTGSGASVELLEQVDVASADLFIAVTDQDEANLVACLLANDYQVPRMIARIKSLEFSKSEWQANAKKLGIDLLINPQSVVAEEIVNVVSYPAATEVAEFAGGSIVFLGYTIGAESPLAEITLRELGDLRGMYRLVVTALSRKEGTVIPRGDDQIRAGDLLYFVCRKEDLPAINYLFGFEKRKTRSIFVLGGGRVGSAVARRLTDLPFKVKVVDRNPEHCAQIARELDGVVVLNTDGTDVDTLKSEGVERADVFIAVTQDDKTNILCSLLAKSHGAKRAICLVNSPQWIGLAGSLGIDACVSPRRASASAVLKYVRRADVVNMAVVEQCDAEVIEVLLPAESPILGRRLLSIDVPRGAIVAAVVRGEEEVVIPTGETRLRAGDRVVVFALPEAVTKVEQFFS